MLRTGKWVFTIPLNEILFKVITFYYSLQVTFRRKEKKELILIILIQVAQFHSVRKILKYPACVLV